MSDLFRRILIGLSGGINAYDDVQKDEENRKYKQSLLDDRRIDNERQATAEKRQQQQDDQAEADRRENRYIAGHRDGLDPETTQGIVAAASGASTGQRSGSYIRKDPRDGRPGYVDLTQTPQALNDARTKAEKAALAAEARRSRASVLQSGHASHMSPDEINATSDNEDAFKGHLAFDAASAGRDQAHQDRLSEQQDTPVPYLGDDGKTHMMGARSHREIDVPHGYGGRVPTGSGAGGGNQGNTLKGDAAAFSLKNQIEDLNKFYTEADMAGKGNMGIVPKLAFGAAPHTVGQFYGKDTSAGALEAANQKAAELFIGSHPNMRGGLGAIKVLTDNFRRDPRQRISAMKDINAALQRYLDRQQHQDAGAAGGDAHDARAKAFLQSLNAPPARPQ